MIGRLWAFSGIDGGGKTTQIDLLVERLRHDGHPVCKIWARGGYTPLFEFAKGLFRKTSPKSLPKSGRSQERTRRFQRPLVRKIWLLIAVFDLVLYYACWVRWLRFMGRTIVADRWVMDTELDFELNFPEESVERWIPWRLAKWLMPRPSEHFIFLIPVDESLRRSVEKKEPFPDSTEVLEKRLTFYRGAIAGGSGRAMDGLRPREDLHAEVLTRTGVTR